MDLVRAGSKVNQRDRLGRTAIFHAAEKSNTEAVRHLIESGANVNLKDRYYFTPLTFAIHTKNIEVVRMLLAPGAHITRSPIMTTALHYKKEIFELILAAPQMTIESAEMALSDKQVAEPVKTLIREFIIAKSGFSPAAAASAAESCESKAVTQTAPCSGAAAAAAAAPEQEQPIEILAPVAAAAARPARHYRATRQCLRELRIAITQRRPEAIEMLRHLAGGGFDVNIRGLHGETLLHLAAQHENIEAVRFLLAQSGIDLHARDNLNNTIIEVTRSEEIRAIIQEATEEQEQ